MRTPSRSVSTARPAPYSRREDSSRARPRGVPRLALRGSSCTSSIERTLVSVGAALAAVGGEAARARVRRWCEVRGGLTCGICPPLLAAGRVVAGSCRAFSMTGRGIEKMHMFEQEGMVASVETTRVATERGSVRRADGRAAGRGDQDRERNDSRRHERHGALHARVSSRRWPGPPATQASARRDAERARSGLRHLEGEAVSAWGGGNRTRCRIHERCPAERASGWA